MCARLGCLCLEFILHVCGPRFPHCNHFCLFCKWDLPLWIPFPFSHPFSASEMARTNVALNFKASLLVSECVFVWVGVFVHVRACALQQCLSTSHVEECVSDRRYVVNQGLWSPLATGCPVDLSVHARPLNLHTQTHIHRYSLSSTPTTWKQYNCLFSSPNM